VAITHVKTPVENSAISENSTFGKFAVIGQPRYWIGGALRLIDEQQKIERYGYSKRTSHRLRIQKYPTFKMTKQSDLLLSRVLGDGPSAYASYSSHIYFHKYSTGQSPTITTDFEKLQSSAKTRLSPEAYDYAAGGAGTSRTMRANREAFDKVRLPLHPHLHC
jgi:hypothetical protein